MSQQSVRTRLVFVNGFTEQEEFEAKCRGCLSHVLVDFKGKLYPVVFYDPVRLGQDLEECSRRGQCFVADPGMIVVPEITRESMEDAAQKLSEEGFFEHFVSISEDQVSSADPYVWPPKLDQAQPH